MSVAINNGLVVDPKNRICSKLNLKIQNGKLIEFSTDTLEADTDIDAEGLIIAPGFIDIHMHEGQYDAANEKVDMSIFNSMVKMGVTTAVGGNCGIGPEDPVEYLNIVESKGVPINFGLLVPHEILRNQVGETNKYQSVRHEKIVKMAEILAYYLDCGLLGISFGIRYVPGINQEELLGLCKVLQNKDKIVSAHIRDDADNVFKALDEFINVGKQVGVPVQVSHIGSMAAFGQMEELLALIDYYKVQGIDVGCDCYPYNAFSTKIGETTYDEGFIERYQTDYDSIEIAEGEYKGQRCSKELFLKLRRNYPELITIAHVMKEEEVDMAVCHPDVIVASDGLLNKNQGHPRASGSFPRVIAKYVKQKKAISLIEAISKMTYLPAKRFGLNKGSLEVGADGDIVVFNLEQIKDKATFQEPVLPPEGIKYVIVNGKIAVKNSKILDGNSGRVIKK